MAQPVQVRPISNDEGNRLHPPDHLPNAKDMFSEKANGLFSLELNSIGTGEADNTINPTVETDAQGNLPDDLFPEALLYRPRPLDESRAAQPTGSAGDPRAAEPIDKARVTRPDAGRALPRSERVALSRALWPIRWLERAQR